MTDKLLIPYLDDEELIRGKVPMTKAIIRHECVRLLKLREGDVFYDIGSGTGSVSIEAAKLSASLRVFSVEKNQEALQLQQANMEKHGITNITLINGTAPEALSGLPKPDAVFIGGSSGRFADILNVLCSAQGTIRAVATAVTLETASELYELSSCSKVKNLFIEQINCSIAKPVGRYRLMQAENPVYIAAFDLVEETTDE